MKQHADISVPFKKIIKLIEVGTDFTEQADTPYTEPKMVAIRYNLMYCTGVFNSECKDWIRMPLAHNTWANFKVNFTHTYDDYNIMQQGVLQSGYQTNNTVCHVTTSENITADVVAKHFTTTEATAQGHLDQQRMNMRSAIRSLLSPWMYQ
jgi:hypothetical protein